MKGGRKRRKDSLMSQEGEVADSLIQEFTFFREICGSSSGNQSIQKKDSARKHGDRGDSIARHT